MKAYTFLFDISQCSACMACVVTCRDQNDLVGDNASFRNVKVHEESEYPTARISALSIACFHCGDAPCLMVCPTGAIFRHNENGIIDLDRDLCVGCHSCQLACPFGAPKFPDDGKMAKCDLCYARIASDLLPACVQVCSTGALTFGNVDDLSAKKVEKASTLILKSVADISK